MDISKLQTLANKLATYEGSNPYWDVMQNPNYTGRILAIDALGSWNSRQSYANRDYSLLADQINNVMKPIVDHMGDMRFEWDNFPNANDHGLNGDSSVEFSEEDYALLGEVYDAYKLNVGASLDVSAMSSLNTFLKELASFPDLTHLSSGELNAGNFTTLADLQNAAKTTTVINDIEGLVASGSSSEPLVTGEDSYKELGALLNCRMLIVGNEWNTWIKAMGDIFDGIGDIVDRLYYLETDSPSTYRRNGQIDLFLMSLGQTYSSHVPHPVGYTNIDEYTLASDNMRLSDIARFSADLINRYINGSGDQAVVVTGIKDKLKLNSLESLANLSKISDLAVYDNKATFGNFVEYESYSRPYDLKNMWDYVNDNSGKV